MYIPALVLIIIVLLFILMRNNQIRMQLEGFSPYMGSDSSYSYIKEKRNDQQLLRCTLNKYEKPFNEYNEGYYNKNIEAIVPLDKSKIVTCAKW